MALNTYRESKHQLYKLAFDEVQKMQIQVIYDKLKTDPDLKKYRDQITKKNPQFFDKDNIVDEDNNTHGNK